MINEYKKESRVLIKKVLKQSFVHVPAQFRQEFYHYHQPQLFKFFLQVNLVAQLAYISYVIADWFILSDVGFTAIILKSLYTLCMALTTIAIYKFSKSILLFDLMLPMSIIGASILWFWLLNLSNSPDVPIYLYASLVFIVLANLCVQIRFKAVLLISFCISCIMLYGAYVAVSGNLHQLKLFALIYTPVLLFSLYISWNSTQKSRIVFLHSKLDQLNREALNIMAHTDVLTGLNNRRHFIQLANYHIHGQLKPIQPLTLLMFDVDKFKNINDQYGHFIGDHVLQQIADISRNALRSQDIIARFGGEEFIILLPRTTLHQAQEIAERLRKAIESSYLKLETQQKLKFTVSIGIAEFGQKNRDLHNVIRMADQALYQAKASGRNAISIYKTAS
ncbi:hypothetical protein B9T33_09575 [Acinetobacter sp. ANC 5054]|uniref:GGDEF domain-containing protein n=1 Tax=Acinetobacter sp. ANC 5054 TaxID=1977877 RepID=UPI000A3458AD|nr:GGDEF domain-containing protein [Acinetobacter sp. ANC 5054]OTG80165.1 hypothetical protein B9T33_09575 [Acinetobacter sp. ANC 5054]